MKITSIGRYSNKVDEKELDYVRFCSVDNKENYIDIKQWVIDIGDILRISNDDINEILIRKDREYYRELFKTHIIIYVDEKIINSLKE